MAAIRDSALTRAFDNDWIGPGLVSLIAVVAISLAQPAFLSSFNIFVLMSAISEIGRAHV